MIITINWVMGLANMFLPVGIETFLWYTIHNSIFREHIGSPVFLIPLSGKLQQAVYSLRVSHAAFPRSLSPLRTVFVPKYFFHYWLSLVALTQSVQKAARLANSP